jgi:hypothetical protein
MSMKWCVAGIVFAGWNAVLIAKISGDGRPAGGQARQRACSESDTPGKGGKFELSRFQVFILNFTTQIHMVASVHSFKRVI